MAIAAVTLAEFAAGPHATDDPAERAGRQERLQLVESTFDAIPFDAIPFDAIPFDAIPFDARVARAYGRVFAKIATAGRKDAAGVRWTC